ncbi:MAG: histidine phosphatase family protein [Candidatus Omnitrophica bacterium]|nr:histidine phosphatase family protein [Candidatus Omnitrophota bacterium]
MAVRIKDVNRKKEQIVIRDPEGRLMVGYYGRIDEKKQGANIVQVKDAKQQTVFSFDAKNFVIDKETVYYYKYDTALEKYGVSREQMRYLGARGIAMVGETYVYDSQKGRQGGSVGSSVVKKISKDSYFDAHGNILLQMYGPKQKLVWQQLVDNKGRKIVDYYGHLEGERFVREKASFSFYTVRHLEEFKANNAALYEQLKNELKSLNIDIESKEYRQRLNSLGKIDVALLGATFSYDNNTHRSQDLLSFSAVKPQPDGRYIDDAGRVLVLGKDFQKKNVNEFLIDSEGRVAVKYSGRFDYKVKKFIREKQTFFYYSYEDKARIEKEYGINLDKNNKDRFETEYGIDLTKKQEMKVLGLYGVAMVGETFTYNNETGKIGGLVANSFLKKFENGEYVDKDGNILVQMTNANQHMSRQDVIDNLGRTIIRYLGKLDLLTNEFERALVARFFYSTQQLESFKEESPELYNQLIEEYKKLGLDIENPDFQEALNRYGKIGVGLIGATYIYSPQKEAVTLTAVSLIKEIGKESYQDARGRTRVRGIYIDNTGDVLVEMKNVLNNLHWQEQIDNDGKIRVKFDGILDENGNFIRNQKTYYFYDYDSFSAFRDAHPELRKELDEWQSKLPKLNNINLRQVMDELGRCGIGMVGFTLLYNEKNQQVVDELLEIRNAVQQADKKALKTIVSAKFSVLKDSIDKLAIPEVMAIFNALIEKEKQGTLSSAQVSSDINEIINKLNEPLSFSFLNTHESSVAMKVAENFVNQFFDVGKDRQAAAALPGLTNHIADFMSASSPDEEQAALTALKNKLLGLDSKLQKSVDDVRADVKKSIAKTLQDLKDKVKKGAGLVADSLGLTLEERKAVLGDIQKALEGIMMKTPEQEKEVIENLVKTLRQKIAITLDEAKLRAAINNISLQSPLTSALLNYNQSPHEILPSHYFKDNGEISVQMVRFKQKLTWEEIKDNFGRPVTVYEWGRVNAGPLQRTKATDYYYTYKDEFAALSGNYYRADDKRFAHLAGDKERIKEAMRAEMEKTMNSMGKLGFALVGKTYLLDREGKRGEKPIASSIVKEIQPEAKGLFQRYFNDKGEMLIQLKNERTKLVWQEVKDAHGRVIYAYDGKMVNGVFKRTKVTRFYYTMDDFKDWNGFFNFIFRKMGEDWEKLGYTKEQMEVEIKNALERLGKYDIATLGSTYRYDPNCAYGINPDFKKGESNLLAISILQKFNPDEYGSIVDKGETDYINDQGYIKPLIYDVKTHLVWMGIKDNKGRIRYKYDGYETAPGKFSWVWVSRINYDWPEDKENLGAIGIAYGSNTYLYKNYLDIDSVAAQLSALAVDFAADSDLKGRLSDVLKVYFEKAVQRDKVVEKLIKQLNTMSAAGLSKQKLIAGLSSEYKIILREFASRYLVSIAMNLRQTTDRVTELALAYNEGDGQFFLKLDNLLKKYFPIAKHRDEVREALKNAVDNEGKKKLDKKDLQGALSDAISGVLINYTAFHIDHGFGKVTTSQIVSFDKEGKVFIDEKGNVIFHMYQKKRNLDYQEVKDNQGRIRILFDGKVTVNVPESQDQERYKHFKRDIMTFSYFEDEELDLISVSNRGEAAFYLSKEEIIKHLTQMKADDVSVILNRHKEVLKPGQLTAYEKEITDCGGLSTLAENLRLAINKTIVVFRDKHQFASPDVIADMIYEDKQQPGYKLSGLSRETLAVLCGGLIGESISESWLIPFDETKESKIDRYFNVSGDIQYEAVEHWKSEVTKNGELLLTKADVHYRRTKDNLGRVIKHTWGYWNNFKDFMSIMQLQAKYQTRYGKFSIADITTAFLTERGWTLFNYSKAVNLDTKTGAVDYAVVKTEIENESEEDSEKLEQQFESYWKLYRIPLSREKMIERIKAKAGCEQAKAKELVERICREVYQDGGFDSEDELIAFFKENNIPLDTRDDDDREFIDTFYEKLKHRLATIAVEPVETGSVSSRPKILQMWMEIKSNKGFLEIIFNGYVSRDYDENDVLTWIELDKNYVTFLQYQEEKNIGLSKGSFTFDGQDEFMRNGISTAQMLEKFKKDGDLLSTTDTLVLLPDGTMAYDMDDKRKDKLALVKTLYYPDGRIKFQISKHMKGDDPRWRIDYYNERQELIATFRDDTSRTADDVINNLGNPESWRPYHVHYSVETYDDYIFVLTDEVGEVSLSVGGYSFITQKALLLDNGFPIFKAVNMHQEFGLSQKEHFSDKAVPYEEMIYINRQLWWIYFDKFQNDFISQVGDMGKRQLERVNVKLYGERFKSEKLFARLLEEANAQKKKDEIGKEAAVTIRYLKDGQIQEVEIAPRGFWFKFNKVLNYEVKVPLFGWYIAWWIMPLVLILGFLGYRRHTNRKWEKEARKAKEKGKNNINRMNEDEIINLLTDVMKVEKEGIENYVKDIASLIIDQRRRVKSFMNEDDVKEFLDEIEVDKETRDKIIDNIVVADIIPDFYDDSNLRLKQLNRTDEKELAKMLVSAGVKEETALSAAAAFTRELQNKPFIKELGQKGFKTLDQAKAFLRDHGIDYKILNTIFGSGDLLRAPPRSGESKQQVIDELNEIIEAADKGIDELNKILSEKLPDPKDSFDVILTPPIASIVKNLLDEQGLGLLTTEQFKEVINALIEKLRNDERISSAIDYYIIEDCLEKAFRPIVEQYMTDIDTRGEFTVEYSRLARVRLAEILSILIMNPYGIRQIKDGTYKGEYEIEEPYLIGQDKDNVMKREAFKAEHTPYILRFQLWEKVFMLPYREPYGLGSALSGRTPLIRYLMRKSYKLYKDEKQSEIIGLMRLHVEFWRRIVIDQVQSKVEPYRRKLFTAARRLLSKPEIIFEQMDMDDLFRYYEDPIEELNINLSREVGMIKNQPNEAAASDYLQKLVDTKLKPAVDNALQEHEPYLGVLKWGWVAFLKELLRPFVGLADKTIAKNKTVSRMLNGITAFLVAGGNLFWMKILRKKDKIEFTLDFGKPDRFWTKGVEKGPAGLKTKKGKRFWRLTMIATVLYNIFMGFIVLEYGLLWASALATGVGGTILGVVFAVLTVLPFILFMPLTYFSIKEIGAFFVAWGAHRRKKTAPLTGWIFNWPKKRLKRSLEKIFIDDNDQLKIEDYSGELRVKVWNDVINHLCEEAKLINKFELDDYLFAPEDMINAESVRNRLKSIKLLKPKNKEANERLRRYISGYFRAKPGIEGFERLPVFSIFVLAGGGEKYYYFINDVIRIEKGEKASKLHHLTRWYRDEYENQMDLLRKYWNREKKNIDKDDQEIIDELLFLFQTMPGRRKEQGIDIKIEQLRNKLTQPEAREAFNRIISEVEDWVNFRMPTSWRWVKSQYYVRQRYREYIEHYYQANDEHKDYREIKLKLDAVLTALKKRSFKFDSTDCLANELLAVRQKQAEAKSLNRRQKELFDESKNITEQDLNDYLKIALEYERLVKLKFQYFATDNLVKSKGRSKDPFLDIDFDTMSEEDIKSLNISNREAEKLLLDFKRYHGEYTRIFAAGNPTNQVRDFKGDQIRFSKYGDAAIAQPYVEGGVVDGMDTHMDIPNEETPNIFRVLTEFNRNPRLGILLTLITIFVEKLNAVGRAMGLAEKGWQNSVLGIKETVDTPGYYGKGFYRNVFMYICEGLQDCHVSEDLVTALMFMLFGMVTKHVTYMKVRWRMPPSLTDLLVPLAKWAAGVVELINKRQFRRYINSMIIPWNEKWGTIVSAWHYVKKVFVVLSIVAFISIGLIFTGLLIPVNPYLALIFPYLWVMVGFVFAEAINLPAYWAHAEHEGSYLKAIWIMLKSIGQNFIFFNMLIPHYLVQGLSEGVYGRPKFLYTEKEIRLKTMNEDFNKYYRQSLATWPAKIAAVLLPITMLIVPVTTMLVGVWFIYFFALIAWLFGPYILTYVIQSGIIKGVGSVAQTLWDRLKGRETKTLSEVWQMERSQSMWDQAVLPGILAGIKNLYIYPMWRGKHAWIKDKGWIKEGGYFDRHYFRLPFIGFTLLVVGSLIGSSVSASFMIFAAPLWTLTVLYPAYRLMFTPSYDDKEFNEERWKKAQDAGVRPARYIIEILAILIFVPFGWWTLGVLAVTAVVESFIFKLRPRPMYLFKRTEDLRNKDLDKEKEKAEFFDTISLETQLSSALEITQKKVIFFRGLEWNNTNIDLSTIRPDALQQIFDSQRVRAVYKENKAMLRLIRKILALRNSIRPMISIREKPEQEIKDLIWDSLVESERGILKDRFPHQAKEKIYEIISAQVKEEDWQKILNDNYTILSQLDSAEAGLWLEDNNNNAELAEKALYEYMQAYDAYTLNSKTFEVEEIILPRALKEYIPEFKKIKIIEQKAQLTQPEAEQKEEIISRISRDLWGKLDEDTQQQLLFSNNCNKTEIMAKLMGMLRDDTNEEIINSYRKVKHFNIPILLKRHESRIKRTVINRAQIKESADISEAKQKAINDLNASLWNLPDLPAEAREILMIYSGGDLLRAREILFGMFSNQLIRNAQETIEDFAKKGRGKSIVESGNFEIRKVWVMEEFLDNFADTLFEDEITKEEKLLLFEKLELKEKAEDDIMLALAMAASGVDDKKLIDKLGQERYSRLKNTDEFNKARQAFVELAETNRDLLNSADIAKAVELSWGEMLSKTDYSKLITHYKNEYVVENVLRMHILGILSKQAYEELKQALGVDEDNKSILERIEAEIKEELKNEAGKKKEDEKPLTIALNKARAEYTRIASSINTKMYLLGQKGIRDAVKGIINNSLSVEEKNKLIDDFMDKNIVNKSIKDFIQYGRVSEEFLQAIPPERLKKIKEKQDYKALFNKARDMKDEFKQKKQELVDTLWGQLLEDEKGAFLMDNQNDEQQAKKEVFKVFENISRNRFPDVVNNLLRQKANFIADNYNYEYTEIQRQREKQVEALEKALNEKQITETEYNTQGKEAENLYGKDIEAWFANIWTIEVNPAAAKMFKRYFNLSEKNFKEMFKKRIIEAVSKRFELEIDNVVILSADLEQIKQNNSKAVKKYVNEEIKYLSLNLEERTDRKTHKLNKLRNSLKEYLWKYAAKEDLTVEYEIKHASEEQAKDALLSDIALSVKLEFLSQEDDIKNKLRAIKEALYRGDADREEKQDKLHKELWDKLSDNNKDRLRIISKLDEKVAMRVPAAIIKSIYRRRTKEKLDEFLNAKKMLDFVKNNLETIRDAKYRDDAGAREMIIALMMEEMSNFDSKLRADLPYYYTTEESVENFLFDALDRAIMILANEEIEINNKKMKEKNAFIENNEGRILKALEMEKTIDELKQLIEEYWQTLSHKTQLAYRDIVKWDGTKARENAYRDAEAIVINQEAKRLLKALINTNALQEKEKDIDAVFSVEDLEKIIKNWSVSAEKIKLSVLPDILALLGKYEHILRWIEILKEKKDEQAKEIIIILKAKIYDDLPDDLRNAATRLKGEEKAAREFVFKILSAFHKPRAANRYMQVKEGLNNINLSHLSIISRRIDMDELANIEDEELKQEIEEQRTGIISEGIKMFTNVIDDYNAWTKFMKNSSLDLENKEVYLDKLYKDYGLTTAEPMPVWAAEIARSLKNHMLGSPHPKFKGFIKEIFDALIDKIKEVSAASSTLTQPDAKAPDAAGRQGHDVSVPQTAEDTSYQEQSAAAQEEDKPAVINLELKARYDAIFEATKQQGNMENPRGFSQAKVTSLDYGFGLEQDLTARLKYIQEWINAIGLGDKVSFNNPENLHVTIQPIKFFEKQEDMTDEEIAEQERIIREALSNVPAFTLRFKGITLTSDGGIFAQGYVDDNTISALRTLLRERFGITSDIPNIVHITLGMVEKRLTQEEFNTLIEEIAGLRDFDIGEVKVNELKFGKYFGSKGEDKELVAVIRLVENRGSQEETRESQADSGESVNDWEPIADLDGKIIVNKKTGRLKYQGDGALVELNCSFVGNRQGKTLGNQLKILQGDSDHPILNALFESEKEQMARSAGKLAEELRGEISEGKVVVVTSRLGRAKESSVPFIAYVRDNFESILPDVEEPLTDEMSFGSARNKPYVKLSEDDDRKAVFAEFGLVEEMSAEEEEIRRKIFDEDDARSKFSGGESRIDLLIRAKRFLKKINAEYPGKTVVIFSHSEFLGAVGIVTGSNVLTNERGEIIWPKLGNNDVMKIHSRTEISETGGSSHETTRTGPDYQQTSAENTAQAEDIILGSDAPIKGENIRPKKLGDGVPEILEKTCPVLEKKEEPADVRELIDMAV